MSGLSEDTTLPDPPAGGPGLFGDAPASAPAPATAYRVLARKYRPAGFADLIGQEAMVRILRNAFALSRVAHAFMLTGVRGVGNTTTARIIARCLNCVGPDGRGGPTPDPCGVCPNCTAILADRHPDVVEMDAASRTGVEDVREIIEATRFRPLQARRKVFIVDEVHMLSRNAFNALLKTLEEPPPHVSFIFATTEIRKVPVTVLSRCQRFDLRRVSMAELTAHFAGIAAREQAAIEPAALELIARAADGSVRDGLSLLDQAIALGPGTGGAADGAAQITAAAVTDMLGLADRGTVFDLLEAVLDGRPAAALAITDAAHARGTDLGLLLGDLLDLAHTLSRLKAIPALRHSPDLPEAERTRGAALAERASVPVLARLWQMLLKGVGEVETAPDRRAAAEMVLIRLCHVADLPPPGDLVRRLAANGGAAPGARPDIAVAASDPTPPAAARPAAPATATALARVEVPRPVEPLAAASAELEAEAMPAPASFRELAALVASRREALLHAHLVHSAHLVRFAPPVIELRPEPDAPRDLAPRLAAVLLAATGRRWTIALSTAAGEPTLAAQADAADAARRAEAAEHPLVRAILDAFPGARIDAVQDSRLDRYGLPPESVETQDAFALAEPEMPDFAPPDAGFADDPIEE